MHIIRVYNYIKPLLFLSVGLPVSSLANLCLIMGMVVVARACTLSSWLQPQETCISRRFKAQQLLAVLRGHTVLQMARSDGAGNRARLSQTCIACVMLHHTYNPNVRCMPYHIMSYHIISYTMNDSVTSYRITYKFLPHPIMHIASHHIKGMPSCSSSSCHSSCYHGVLSILIQRHECVTGQRTALD